jgi:hypothetical protein
MLECESSRTRSGAGRCGAGRNSATITHGRKINKRKKQKLLALVAITEPRKADEKNKYANVGTFIVIRGPVSPMKLCQESAHK